MFSIENCLYLETFDKVGSVSINFTKKSLKNSPRGVKSGKVSGGRKAGDGAGRGGGLGNHVELKNV